ncbi:MAG: class I SAM-dependent methyltransferase, partial [Clostridia bacterium]|nr:class I SAM-dependent methyltransferase [Clostridia bacterium]
MNGAYRSLAAFYDRLMADVDYDGWAEYLMRLLGAKPPGGVWRIVDCGCGTGAVMLRLLRRGAEVVGLDISEEMLAVAGERLRDAGFGRAPLVRMDMRALTLHRPAEALISVCDGVNYLTREGDAERFFRAAYAALEPGGRLLFDVSSIYKMETMLDGRTFGEDLEDFAYLWQNSYDADARLMQMDLSFFSRGPDGRYTRSEETQFQRAYGVDELVEALARSGFADVRVYEAFLESPPGPASER